MSQLEHRFGSELTVQQILEVAKPFKFTRAQQRSRNLLLEALSNVPQDVYARVVQACQEIQQSNPARVAKNKSEKGARNASRKRRASVTLESQSDLATLTNKQTTEDVPHATHHAPDRDVNQFLDLPTEEETMDLHRNFLAATSNDALSQGVCASCGRRLMQSELSREDFLSFSNHELLCPTNPHRLHILTHGMLLETQFIEDSSDSVLGWICNHCSTALRRGQVPAYSLANGMWVGPTPTVLSMLTIPEQLLISLRYPRAYVFKLYPRGGADHPNALQSGLRGNVTTYMTNVQAVSDMLSGQLMPRAPDVLPSLIAIAFIGTTRIFKSALKYLFCVRRRMVYAALLELKDVTQHPGYQDINIDGDILSKLPEDNIPTQLLHTIRFDSDEEAVLRESAGYVPTDNPNSNPTVIDDFVIVDDHDGGGHQSNVDEFASNRSSAWAQECANFPVYSNPASVANEPQDTQADIIPLEYSGTIAADGTQITPKELVMSAIENLRSELPSRNPQESGYGVCHGGFARDFGKRIPGTDDEEYENPSTYTFPGLFPFGLGGLEDNRVTPVSFVEHTRWCLQYHDGRFRKHHTFAFWAFSIQQKRQALAASKIAIRRRDFEKASAALSQITIEDLDQATLEEEQNQPLSDPNVILLRKLTQVTMQRVMGSDASRAVNRSKLWSTSLYLGPMPLWITMNPADRHDPICQVLVGQQLNMDDFNPLLGPSALERARNVAQDPCGAAHFFFFLAQTVIETIFGFSPKGRRSANRMGALGLGSAYFGVVEAQGRGSLHLHMVMWLQNAPNASETIEMLKSKSFREKVKCYVQRTMHSHVDGLDQAAIDCMEPESSLPWSRPPNPDSPTYAQDLALLELRLARSQQYHQCSDAVCLRFDHKTKTKTCKRHAPFPLSSEVEVTETGEVKTQRSVPNLVTWNPDVSFAGRCNNNIQFVSNGSQSRKIGFYITNYATKKQARTYNESALFAKTYRFHSAANDNHLSSRQSNEAFVRRCGLAITREQELSGQQVMSYLMGWGDTIQSHTYTPIYWFAVVRTLKAKFPELKSHEERFDGAPGSDTTGMESNPNAETTEGDETTTGDNETSRVDVSADGTWYLRSQIVDYQYRGEYLENYNFLDYFVDTYEESSSRRQPPSSSGRGRPQNIRIPYLASHPRSSTAVRVLRSPRHCNLPNIIGKWFERNDNPDTYDLHCASVLACLKPWRQLSDLKDPQSTWAQARLEFDNSANDHQRCVAANMQYYYQCRDAAERVHTTEDGVPIVKKRQAGLEDLELSELINGLQIPAALLTKSKQDLLYFAEQAVKIGRRLGIFRHGDEGSWSATPGSVSVATPERYNAIARWDQALHNMHKRNDTILPGAESRPSGGDVDELMTLYSEAPRAQATIEYAGDTNMEHENDPDVSMLSNDQLISYMVVKNHLDKYNNRDGSPQLLFHIPGEGGTGKSLIISKITDLLRARGQLHTLRKAAYTGIAASMIEGSTLHKLAELKSSGDNLSGRAIE